MSPVFTIAALQILLGCSATPHYPELDPKFQSYQDASKGFPLTQTWYVLYRNYEKDPAFGTSKCLRYTHLKSEKDGQYRTLAQYGENKSAEALMTLVSTEGYAAKNQLNIHPDGHDCKQGHWRSPCLCACGQTREISSFPKLCSQICLQKSRESYIYAVCEENITLPLYISFLDVKKCAVSRSLYVNEDACSVVVPEDQLGKSTTCCDFIYDLLCGTNKYQISEASCKKQH